MAIGDAAFSSGDIMRRLHQLESELRELRSARRLENATIGAGGVRVAGGGSLRSTSFNGDLAQDEPGTTGWALGADKLVLRGQFVGPVAFGTARGFTAPVTHTAGLPPDKQATAKLFVPGWADEALILVTADVTADNTSAQNDDALFVSASAGSVTGEEMMVAVNSGRQLPVSSSLALVVGNPESTIEVACRTRTNIATWPGDGSNNRCAVSAIAVFRQN